MSPIPIIIAVLLTAVISVPVTYYFTSAYQKKVVETKIGSADEKARAIIDEAVKTAETKKRESLLEVKEESIRTKNELDREIKERRAEIQRNERRIEQRNRIWIKSWMRLKSAKPDLQPRKKRSTGRRKKSRG